MLIEVFLDSGSLSDSPVQGSLWLSVRWDESRREKDDVRTVSLVDYVNEHSARLIQKYNRELDQVADSIMCHSKTHGLQIRPNLHYWWLSIPSLSSLQANSEIYSAIKLLALEDLVAGSRPPGDFVTVLRGGNKYDRALLVHWCAFHSVPCSYERAEGRQPLDISRLRPKRLQAMRVWFDLVLTWLSKRHFDRAPVSPPTLTVIDYLQRDALHQGVHSSPFWGSLTRIAPAAADSVHWLHMSANYATRKVIQRDRRVIRSLNDSDSSHKLLHDYVTFGVIRQSLQDYWKVQRLTKYVSKIVDKSALGPALQFMVTETFFGRTAMLNTAWLNLFEEAAKKSVGNRLNLYLYENQPWELAMLSAWQNVNDAVIAGFAHTTLLQWDTRYNKSERTWLRVGGTKIPQPNLILVNGPFAVRQAKSLGLPDSRIVVVGSLRSLADFRSSEIRQPDSAPMQSPTYDICILGEYDQSLDGHMMDLISQATQSIDYSMRICYRAHPSRRSAQVKVPSSVVVCRHTTLRETLLDSRVAICGPTSSAALDALSLGRAAIIISDPRIPLANPALGLPNVFVATSSSSLNEILQTKKWQHFIPIDFSLFFAGQGNDRWQEFIESLVVRKE